MARKYHKQNESAIRDIRELKRIGFTCDEIAAAFNTCSQNVSAICNRITWRHVGDKPNHDPLPADAAKT